MRLQVVTRCVTLLSCRRYMLRRVANGNFRYWHLQKLWENRYVTECWFPLGHGDKNLLSDPTIATIAEKHGKTIVQIILRWHIQEEFSVIPGNTNPEWIKENISIFDFKLDDEDMATMRSLNQEKRFYNMSLEQLERFVLGRKWEN
ncbi:MAG: aldo/keto reductase [Bacteroidaceae bacterium]|nr:aldo/keto reductase [Bacteroidaceae bacterium]